MSDNSEILSRMNELVLKKKFTELQQLIFDYYENQQHLSEINSILSTLLKRGYSDKVILITTELLKIKIDFDLLMFLGKSENINKNYEEAIKVFSNAQTIRTDSIVAIFNLGLANQNYGNRSEAIKNFERIIDIRNDIPEVYYNLGNVYRSLEKYDKAEILYKKCCELSSTNPDYFYNLAVVQEKQLMFREALSSYNKAIEINPNFVYAHWNKALALLTLGNYKTGWKEFEWRLLKYEHQRNDLPFEYWKGENLDGKKLLIYDEQGFGDSIQFMRFISLISKKYSVEITIECKVEIYSLLKDNVVASKYYVRGAKEYSRNEFDFKVSFLSLPLLLKINKSNIKFLKPYIYSESKNEAVELNSDKILKIGVVWSGNPEHQNDRFRSIDINKLLNCLKNINVQIYSLQKGKSNDNFVIEILKNHNVIDLNNQINNFMDTKNFIAQLDLIISVDTSVAHLAGAMMKPVWILLPANPDWRWGLTGDESLWYPTAKLFRQNILGDWNTVLQNISDELANLTSKNINLDVAKMNGKAIEFFNNSKFDEAAKIFELILCENESDAPVYNNLAICYQQMGLFDKAIDNSNNSIRLNPHYFPAYNTLAINYYEIGDNQKAVETLKKVLKINSQDEDTLFNLAHIFHKTGEYESAKKYYELVYQAKVKTSNLYYNFGLLLIEQNEYSNAKTIVAEGRQLFPNDYSILFLAGNIEKHFENFDAAEKLYFKSLQINPDFVEAYLNLANNYYLTHRIEEALEVYNLLNENGIEDSRIDFSKGVLFFEKNDLTKAEKYFRRAINKDKNDADFHIALAEVFFAKGDFKNGWTEYEWRFKKEQFSKIKNIYPNNLEELKNKKILIYEEQGIGDTFQFLRYVKEIKTTENNIIFAARNEIKDLLSTVKFIDEVVNLNINAATFDLVFSVVALAKYFVNDVSDIKNISNSQILDKHSINSENRLPNCDMLKVGICWRGNKFPVHNRKRHAEIKDFESLFSLKTVKFFSLQKDITEEESYILNSYKNVVNLSSQLTTFKETADFCSQMDLIISVDTSVLHLAGAMGKETWALLAYSPDWRWRYDEKISLWYPVMKLFKQKSMFEWDDVFNNLKIELKKVAEKNEY